MPRFSSYGRRKLRRGLKFKAKGRSSMRNRSNLAGGRKAYWAPKYQVTRAQNPSSLGGQRIRTKHVFSCSLDQTTVAGILVPYVFRGNDLFDPDVTGGGVSAAGYTQMASQYSRFVVYGSSCRLQAITTTAGASAHIVMLPTISSTAVSTDSNDYAMQPYAKDQVLFGQAVGVRANQQLRTYMATSTMQGRPLFDPALSGTSSGSPTAPWYWHIKINPISGTDVNVQYIVHIVYYTEWHNRLSIV